MALTGTYQHATRIVIALGLVVLAGCTPREGYGLRAAAFPATKADMGRVSAGTLFLADDGPAQTDTQFLIPDRHAKRSEIRLETLSQSPTGVTLLCDGPARIRHPEAPDLRLAPGDPRRITLPPRGQPAVVLDWAPQSGHCRVDWGKGHSVALRPESSAAPHLSRLAPETLDCRVAPGLRLDPLQQVFLDEGPMLQTCPVDPGQVRILADPLDALNARIEALTGRPVARDLLETGNPDLPLDFSAAPRLDLIQLSYLHMRADFSGYLTARMLAFHALRGTQVRILVTGVLMQKKDRALYDSLSARYPNIQIQYYEWQTTGVPRPGDVIKQVHRVQHTRAFLTLSPDPGRSRYIFGGRNLHDGFFFAKPFDLTGWPSLRTYEQGGFQGLGFFSTYEDLEIELRDDTALRSVAAHHLALWNRDAETQRLGPARTGETDRRSGMRHYLSLPWADGRDQIRWFAEAIDAAATEVLIVTPYLNPPAQIQQALVRAKARGVRVRMVVRLDSTDPAGFVITALNRRYAARYSDLFEISEYFPRPRMMHTKMMVIDRRLAVSTSSNLDHRAFWHDTENGLVFLDTPQVGALVEVAEAYRRKSRRLTSKESTHPLSEILYSWPWLRSVF